MRSPSVTNLLIDLRSRHNLVPIAITSAMVAIALLGIVIGQLIFGYLGDRIGLWCVYGLALICMLLSSIGCRFSICTSATCVLMSLGFFRIDDGSSDRLNPGFLMEPYDAKLWEAGYPMSPFEDFDFVSTGNMIEEIFGSNIETSKLSDKEKH
ncbi:putative inorganic phosphate transporter 1-8 [Camellia lanceoleosa]|uniref:Inorganic phosphate transporter 1-8 n=1 Tax=Camellia lanceoleosa TaxID=1840588 RepID=A0ACC0HLN4_9ERIC|nr:putative inorganic phosphate transporter 1-8 [Camellia lanceoleosa]